jgi:hypothetical protein
LATVQVFVTMYFPPEITWSQFKHLKKTYKLSLHFRYRKAEFSLPN